MGVIGTATRFEVKSDVVARTVGDEMILLDLETGTYFTLNAVGALVWRGLESSSSIETIATTIVEQYEVDATTALAAPHDSGAGADTDGRYRQRSCDIRIRCRGEHYCEPYFARTVPESANLSAEWISVARSGRGDW